MNKAKTIACSNCFSDEGLRLDAEYMGQDDKSVCPNCSSTKGQKLTVESLTTLTHNFFVWGTFHTVDYGGAPILQFNDRRKTDFEWPESLRNDTMLIENLLGVGFFFYGPRFWMLGEVTPLKLLQHQDSCEAILNRIVQEYNAIKLTSHDKFYRIRINPTNPANNIEYDSPPESKATGRLSSPQIPVLYASPDIELCLHECRVTVEDQLFVATLNPTDHLNLLDVSIILEEPGVTEFDSLDLTVFMLFMAGEHSYPILRSLSETANRSGFDGIVYPSYFSMLRNGVKPFETTFGMWNRMIPQYMRFEQAKISKNLALFGRPIKENKIEVACINKIVLSTARYSMHFGPVIDTDFAS